MNFDLTDEQRLLRDWLAGSLGRSYGFEDRSVSLKQAGWRPALWKAWAQVLGLFRATLPVDAGGFGGGPVETMLIMEEMGKMLATDPYIEAVVLALALLQDSGPMAGKLAESVMDGDAIVIPAIYESGSRFNPIHVTTTAERIGETWRVTGAKIAVIGAPAATHFLVSARALSGAAAEPSESLFLIKAGSPKIKHQDCRLIDGRSAADVTLVSVEAVLLAGLDETAERLELAFYAGTAAVCVEALRVMQAMLEQTISYAQQRRRFGRPINRFQILQHRMVECVQSLGTIPLACNHGGAVAWPARIGTAIRCDRRNVLYRQRDRNGRPVGCAIPRGDRNHGRLRHFALFRRATVLADQFGSASFHRGRMARRGWPVMKNHDQISINSGA